MTNVTCWKPCWRESTLLLRVVYALIQGPKEVRQTVVVTPSLSRVLCTMETVHELRAVGSQLGISTYRGAVLTHPNEVTLGIELLQSGRKDTTPSTDPN